MATATEQAQEHLAEKPEPLPNGSTNGNDKPQSPPDFGGRFDAPPASAEYRPPYKPAYGPQRFMSGQSLSQASGPTPTLNQLLQNNPPRPNYDYPQWQPRPIGYPQGPYRPPHPQQQVRPEPARYVSQSLNPKFGTIWAVKIAYPRDQNMDPDGSCFDDYQLRLWALNHEFRQ